MADWRKATPWIDGILVIWTLASAFWQFLLIDRALIGFVGVWMVPPLIAVAVKAIDRSRSRAYGWATAYLTLMSFCNVIASNPKMLPWWQALHPAATDFAVRWNLLDLGSRRLISGNMLLASAFLFAGIGYVLFWMDLRCRWQGGEGSFSTGTCILGLFALWFLPAMALLTMLAIALLP